MKRRYKVVVSDFHLGKGRFFRDGSVNIMEDFIYDREFAEFLAYYSSGEFADAEVEVVLNGDILNLIQMDYYGVFTHMFTERVISHFLEQIVKGHPEFFAGLRKFAAVPGHKISYVVGNHDIGMLFQKPRDIFSEACGFEVKFYDTTYIFDGVHIEHGQQYERFAQTDMNKPFISRGLPEPVINLPWGSLFVAVMLPKIKMERPHVDKVRPFQIFLRWAFIHDFIWSCRTAVEIGRFVFDSILFRRRYQIRTGFRATFGLLKEITLFPVYDKIAKKLLEERDDIHTVIFGHTHILEHRQFREGKEYFNEGSWNEVTGLDLGEYGTKTRLTYAFVEYPIPVEIEAQSQDLRPQIRLKEWKGHWRPVTDVII